MARGVSMVDEWAPDPIRECASIAWSPTSNPFRKDGKPCEMRRTAIAWPRTGLLLESLDQSTVKRGGKIIAATNGSMSSQEQGVNHGFIGAIVYFNLLTPSLQASEHVHGIDLGILTPLRFGIGKATSRKDSMDTSTPVIPGM